MLHGALKNRCLKKVMSFCLKSWQPEPTWRCSIISFAVIGLILISIGIGLLIVNVGIVEVSMRYDDYCLKKDKCLMTLVVNDKMKQPIFFYYGMDNFYQNHKRFISSKSQDQLMGKKINNKKAVKDCTPVITNEDMGVTKSLNGKLLNPKDIAYPCGSIARAFFTDSFKLYRASKPINIDETNIAWNFDKTEYYKNGPGDYKSYQWIDVEDEHFINWMRISTLPSFKKLWGRINQDLEPGRYSLEIDNNYQVDGISGSKYVYLTTGSGIGGKNLLLPLSYIGIGGTCLVGAFFFLLSHKVHKRRLN